MYRRTLATTLPLTIMSRITHLQYITLSHWLVTHLSLANGPIESRARQTNSTEPSRYSVVARS